MSLSLQRVVATIAPLPEPAPEDRAAIEAILGERAMRSALAMAASSPFIALFYALLLAWRSGIDRVGLAGWVAFVVLASATQLFTIRRIKGGADPQQILSPLGRLARVAMGGAVWGSLPAMAQPRTAVAFVIVALVLIGAMAVNAMVYASLPRYFWSYDLGILSTASVGLGAIQVSPSSELILLLWGTVPIGAFLGRLNRSSELRAASMAVANARIAAELADRNHELAHEATHDALTGLANRASFIAELNDAMDRGGARLDLGVLFIDLDRFKVVNDALGHAAGDSVLTEASRRLSERLRSEDLLARLGGDEFTILVRRSADLEQVALRVLEAFEAPFEIEGRSYDVRASIGSAVAEPGMSPTDVLRAADAALYLAKDEGRGRIRAFDERLRAKIDRQLDEEARLRRAIDDRDIEGWFQPIVSLTTGRIDAAETLARWRIGDRVRAAGEFLGTAEDSGLTAEVSRAVVPDLLEVRRRADDAGLTLGLGLNVPPVHLAEMLSELSLADDLLGLIVEITENGLIADLDVARAALDEVRARGAKVWLDDFGQGRSSLSLVTELPLDGIKIDKSFVGQMFHSRAAHTVVVAITELGRRLGLDVIAEGVETAEQAEALADLGVSHAQGFLVSPAVSADEFVAMATSGRRWAGARGGSLVRQSER